MRFRARYRVLSGAVALAVGIGLACVGPADGATYDTTSKLERKRVDSVKTPKLDWYACLGGDGAECSTVELPLDYDKRSGAKVEVALLRRKARVPNKRIGTLFLNPGGPTGSGTAIAYFSHEIFSSDILDRFDIVGFDPRGTNFSDQVKCFSSPRKQAPVLNALSEVVFPYGAQEERPYVRAAKKLGQACADDGRPLSTAVSTAEVARDLDVLRRAVGDSSSTYLGFSYGTYVGQVYANLFPDRVRALVLDGNIDPVAWAGPTSQLGIPVDDRLKSADGSLRALREILKRCKAAGPDRCRSRTAAIRRPSSIRSPRDSRPSPWTSWTRTPVRSTSPTPTPSSSPRSWESSISRTGHHSSPSWSSCCSMPRTTTPDGAQRRNSGCRHSTKRSRRGPRKRALRPRASRTTTPSRPSSRSSVPTPVTHRTPTSGRPTPRPPTERAKYFGAYWVWGSAWCASGDAFDAKDEDAYRASFTAKTIRPVLVVGSYWDPATPYGAAVKVSKLMPNSRLLSSDSWGHTAYGTSSCATRGVDLYLLTGTLPPVGTVCKGDFQPFTEDLGEPENRTIPDVVGAGRP